MFVILAFVDEIFVILAFVDEIFAMLAFDDERFVIDAVVKLASKNDALLPDKLYIHALVDESVV